MIRNTIWNICKRAVPPINYGHVSRTSNLYADLCRGGHGEASTANSSFYIKEGHEQEAAVIIRRYEVQVDFLSDSD